MHSGTKTGQSFRPLGGPSARGTDTRQRPSRLGYRGTICVQLTLARSVENAGSSHRRRRTNQLRHTGGQTFLVDEEYRAVPFSRPRCPVVDTGRLIHRRHVDHRLLGLDVTEPGRIIREHKTATGERLPFTGFIITSLAQGVETRPIHGPRVRRLTEPTGHLRGRGCGDDDRYRGRSSASTLIETTKRKETWHDRFSKVSERWPRWSSERGSSTPGA